jgi:cytosine deaminase
MTRVPEMLAAGIPVAFGHDCVMDPWYSLGSGDMLEVAHMGLHVAQMTGQDAMRACFTAVTETPARILGLDGYGSRRAAAPTWCCCRRATRWRRSACAPRGCW